MAWYIEHFKPGKYGSMKLAGIPGGPVMQDLDVKYSTVYKLGARGRAISKSLIGN